MLQEDYEILRNYVIIHKDKLNELIDTERVLLEMLEDIYKPECMNDCDECSSNKSMKYPERDAGPKAYEDDIVAQDALWRFRERRSVENLKKFFGGCTSEFYFDI